ncbi:MAG: DUF493 family protein [Bacteroidota bacterium]
MSDAESSLSRLPKLKKTEFTGVIEYFFDKGNEDRGLYGQTLSMDYRGDIDKFKELLDQEHNWPSKYTFKFIVKSDQEDQVEALFKKSNVNIRKKPSSGRKYTSITIQAVMASSDDVVAIYNNAASIEGIISL